MCLNSGRIRVSFRARLPADWVYVLFSGSQRPLLSDCGLHCVRYHSMDFMLMPPMQPRQVHTADQFSEIKRLRQYIVCSEIQGFSPEFFVRKSGRDDQRRCISQRPQFFQHVDPYPAINHAHK